MIGGEDGDYILQVRGESMKDAGILEGDYVVVRPADDAADGEIVVALIGEEATVKRFFREDDHIRLQPENEAMEPILTTEARVLGRVVGVFRKVWPSRRRIVAEPRRRLTRPSVYHRRAGRATAGGEKTLRGKSGHHRARRWVTPTRGNPRDSATEIHGRWRGHT